MFQIFLTVYRDIEERIFSDLTHPSPYRVWLLLNLKLFWWVVQKMVQRILPIAELIHQDLLDLKNPTKFTTTRPTDWIWRCFRTRTEHILDWPLSWLENNPIMLCIIESGILSRFWISKSQGFKKRTQKIKLCFKTLKKSSGTCELFAL